MKSAIVYLFLLVVLIGCKDQPTAPNTALDLPKRPNILWLVAEDLSPVIPSFGDSTILTPTLSRLAAEGVCYDNFYSPSPVCAPSRFAIATGMYPSHLGANHMRTGPWFAPEISPEIIKRMAQYMPEGITPYETVTPPTIKMMSEYLRKAGYYCTNNSKNDYQFLVTATAWDENSNDAHWRNRTDKNQPFFAIFNFGVTHESQIWAKANDSLWVDEHLEVPVPPYLPDTEVGKQDVRRMYSNVKQMDHQVGEILKQLEEDGELENTIIFWYTDHGGPLPRQKRLLYDSGLKVPLIVRFPNQSQANTRNDDLLSFIDLAPTVLSLAGIAPDDSFDGKAFLGDHARTDKAQYIHAAADRFDAVYDHNRAVRDKRFKYIKYYDREKPMFLHVAYRDQMPIMQELYRLQEAGELTDAQAQWFRETKPEEELFDILNDPYELNDISKNPKYADKLAELRQECDRWVAAIDDKNLKPEKELLATFYPNGEQPTMAMPTISNDHGTITLSCQTEGASIGYKVWTGDAEPTAWQVYTSPFVLEEGQQLKVVADRIGYVKSVAEL